MSSSRVKGLNILLDIVVLLTDTCTCCLYTHNGVGCLTAIVPTVRITCVESGQQSRAEQIRADLAAHHTADCEVQAAEHFVLQYGISNTVSTCQQRKLLRYTLYKARAGKNRTGSWRKGSICNRYWSGKSNIYYICVGVCVCVCLQPQLSGMLCACAVLSSVACPALRHFPPHYLINGMIFGDKKFI